MDTGKKRFKNIQSKEGKMKRHILSIVFLAAMIIFVSPAHALLVSNSDAWEYTNISSITAGTIHVRSNANNMFGPILLLQITFTPYLTTNKAEVTGTRSNGPWMMLITLGSFNMVAAHDGGQSPWYHDQDNRGISAFKLEYEDASNVWQTLFWWKISGRPRFLAMV